MENLQEEQAPASVNRRKLLGQIGAALAVGTVASASTASASIATRALKPKGLDPTIKSTSITFVSIDATPSTVAITLTPKGTAPVTGWLFSTSFNNGTPVTFTLSPSDFADFANFINVVNNNP